MQGFLLGIKKIILFIQIYTWNSCIMTLVHKARKDPDFASYRSNSLLNIDHNLLSAILARM